MKKTKMYFLPLFLLFIISFGSLASTTAGNDSSFSQIAEKAYYIYNLDMIKGVLEKINKEIINNPNDRKLLYEQVFTEYRLLGFSYSPTNSNIFNELFDTVLNHATRISAYPEYESEGKTLMAGTYIIRLSIKRNEAVSLSSKINSLLEEALKINSENPRALLLKAMMKVNTPETFGGNKTEALGIIKKSLQIFEKENKVISWGKLEAITWVGYILMKLNEYEEANFMFNKALDIEPEHAWINRSLLPQLKKLQDKKQ